MDQKTRLLLLLDAFINLSLGIILLLFPLGIPQVLGLPVPAEYIYPSILGGILVGIGLALLVEWGGGKWELRGLGLAGAVAINLCGGITLISWLILDKLYLGWSGALILWVIALLVLSIGLIEIVAWFRVNSTKAS